jgi:hypothetical protein
VKSLSTKTQLAVILVAYAGILTLGGVAFYNRRLQQGAHPADVAAASGMYAAGDMMLGLFIAFLLMLPTFFLIRLLSKFETAAAIYSKILLMVALSAPLALGAFLVGGTDVSENLEGACLLRLLWSPLILTLIAFSRFVAKYEVPRRLASYALVSEAAALCGSLALVIFSMRSGVS